MSIWKRNQAACVLLLISGLLLLFGGRSDADEPNRLVEVKEGTTYLSRVGLYEVGYQSYGEDPVTMPVGWMGSMEKETGISYNPGLEVNGRNAIFMHSPWRISPGRTWVDYRLEIPDKTPVLLKFGISLRPQSADDSDGVTFSSWIRADDEFQQLTNTHHTSGAWKDFERDLSEFAGQTITLRLQVEPGPDRNSSFDHAYFGEPRLLVGSESGSKTMDPRKRLRKLTSKEAYQAVEDVDLRSVANRSDQGVVSSNLLSDFSNEVSRTEDEYHLTYRGADCSITYVYKPETATLRDVTVLRDEQDGFFLSGTGGIQLVGASGEVTEGNVREVKMDKSKNQLTATCRYEEGGTSAIVDWTFGIQGKALTVHAESSSRSIKTLTLGHPLAQRSEKITASYLPRPIQYLPQQDVFTFRMLNWKETNATKTPYERAIYHKTTEGKRHKLDERGYISVSPHLREVLPNIPNEPSSYMEELASDIVLDVWGPHRGQFKEEARLFRRIKDAGVDHMSVIHHKWQRHGYDQKLPDHYPANPDLGGHEQLKELGRTAKELGYPFALHENYIDLYPNAPSYDPEARALKQDGTPYEAWFHPGTEIQSFGLSHHYALKFARENSPKMHDAYHTTASFLDVHSTVAPWRYVDHDAKEPMAAKGRRGVKYATRLFDYLRETHGGHLFGEGGSHFYWAGLVDGVEAELRGRTDRENHVPMPEFDLLKIHPQMVNHGMGYYTRWYDTPFHKNRGVTTDSPKQIDHYRAQQLAYGHAGFIGTQSADNIQKVAKEHHLVHPLQSRYADSTVERVDYFINGQYVSPKVALLMDNRKRQRITYHSGITLWVNFSGTNWTVQGHTLPQYGWYASGPGVEACTARDDDGNIFDSISCDEYRFVDARTTLRMPYVKDNKRSIRPRLRNLQHKGGPRIQLTYEWSVEQSLQTDYRCFVHFHEPGRDEIAFQQDHNLDPSTTKWNAGETIVDGPYEMTIPDDGASSYQITAGLYHPGDGRLVLNGPMVRNSKILLGTLHVDRSEGNVTDVTLERPDPSAGQEAVDFSAHMNPPGTTVDFGEVRTDGSVKIEESKNGLLVIPYPMGETFDVTLDLDAFAQDADRSSLEITAQEELTHDVLRTVPYEEDGNEVTFTVGKQGARRYLLSW